MFHPVSPLTGKSWLKLTGEDDVVRIISSITLFVVTTDYVHARYPFLAVSRYIMHPFL